MEVQEIIERHTVGAADGLVATIRRRASTPRPGRHRRETPRPSTTLTDDA